MGPTRPANNHCACTIPAGLQVLEMKLTIDGLEKERDFYFGKLRDIEVTGKLASIAHIGRCLMI